MSDAVERLRAMARRNEYEPSSRAGSWAGMLDPVQAREIVAYIDELEARYPTDWAAFYAPEVQDTMVCVARLHRIAEHRRQRISEYEGLCCQECIDYVAKHRRQYTARATNKSDGADD